jgi:hypothetical protein
MPWVASNRMNVYNDIWSLTRLYYANVNKNEKNVLPTHSNINTTLYLSRRRQTFINIDQFSWKIYLSCFASVIDKGDYFVKHLHDPNGFLFWLMEWLIIVMVNDLPPLNSINNTVKPVLEGTSIEQTTLYKGKPHCSHWGTFHLILPSV